MKTKFLLGSLPALLIALPLLFLPAVSAQPAGAGPQRKLEPIEDTLMQVFPGTVVAYDLEAMGFVHIETLAGQRLAGPTVVPAEKGKEKEMEDVLQLSSFCVGAGLGATVGGAQDARYFRAAANRGDLPEPDTITAEGLFGEHDLPLRRRQKSRSLLVLNAEAMPATLLTKPEVRYLAQVGLSSGLNAWTWHRQPLNLVAVVDKSGSMSGEPLDLVKRSLRHVLRQLGDADQLSIVLYGDRSHVHLEPTRTTRRNREVIGAAIDAIESAGSTNMEAGLKVGFDLARRSGKGFPGRTRVMQFTDEQPNTGDTSPEGFMGLMEAGARDGIGQTTIGVGEQFDAELAARISTVHGGNQFYFATAKEMEKTFSEELDLMVTELAYDLELKVQPAPGLHLAGIYGIPVKACTWDEHSLRFHVSTVFPSKRKGAIYLAFAPDRPEPSAAPGSPGLSLATLDLSYREAGKTVTNTTRLEVPVVKEAGVSAGLRRGRLLVSEYLGLRDALVAHAEEHDSRKAYKIMENLNALLATDRDRSLDRERQLVSQLVNTLGQVSGYFQEQLKERERMEEVIVLSPFVAESGR